jgi:HD-GYP domain-containing protein (c-di-GMP phosphodiesterase class II)
MVADTIDAMTTVRPYRGALSEADVRAELLKLRGEQFDPAIVDTLLASPSGANYSHRLNRNTQSRALSLAARCWWGSLRGNSWWKRHAIV